MSAGEECRVCFGASGRPVPAIWSNPVKLRGCRLLTDGLT